MVVMFRDPETLIAQAFAMLRQGHRVADGGVSGLPGRRDRLVEYRKTLHHADLSAGQLAHVGEATRERRRRRHRRADEVGTGVTSLAALEIAI